MKVLLIYKENMNVRKGEYERSKRNRERSKLNSERSRYINR